MNKDLLILLLSSNQPRRLKLIKNLLNGKKTVSTLFWGERYNLLEYSGIMKHFNLINNENKVINELINCGYAFQYDKYKYQLTNKGKVKKNSLIESFYLPKKLSYNLDYDFEKFKSRFLLLIQVVSEYSYHNVNYYPVHTDFYDTYLVKSLFHKYKNSYFVDRTYNLINAFLSSLNHEKANIFANLLIGHNDYGLTYEQLAKKYNYSKLEIYFINIDLWIMMIHFIENSNSIFFYLLLNDIVKSKISDSARKTFIEFQNGNTINNIAKKYKLKTSTVKEHLLENAIFLDKYSFPYNVFLSMENMSLLKENYLNKSIDAWRFSDLNDVNIDFFKFRLYQIMRSK